MPDDTITLVSTTDSAEEVQAALTNKPVEKPAEKTGEAAEAKTAEAAPPEETPEQAAERESRDEASEAGSALAKRRAKIQAAIDKDIQRKTAARLDAEAEEARVNELRRQREELEAGMPQAREAQKADAPVIPDGPLGRPEPTLDAVDDKGDAKYANYEAYLSDHAVWTKEEAILAARQVISEKETADRVRIERDSTNRVVNERLADYNSKLETFKKTHADFDAAVDDAREAVQAALVGLGPNAMKVIDGFTVFDAVDGPALTYYLLKRPDELKAIAMLAPPQQLVALTRLESRITPAGAPKKNGPSAVVAETKAPEPIRPVGSGPTATTVPLDEESFQDYKARRARELRAKQGL